MQRRLKMRKKSPTKKDYEKIILIQERIINAKENNIKQVQKLFEHYLDKSNEYSWWYTKYKLFYDALILCIKSTSDAKLVYELKNNITQGDMKFWRSND